MPHNQEQHHPESGNHTLENQELQNPVQVRFEKLMPWQQMTLMACLCERMYPNYALFCNGTEFGDARKYREILDSIWEILTVKSAKINFERQLEKLEEIIPSSEDFEFYAVYPAIDACIGLSILLHALLDKETTFEALMDLSQLSVKTVAQLEEAQGCDAITNENQKENEAVCQEWDVQWALFRPLREAEVRDNDLIKDLRNELREDGVSNIGMSVN